MDWNFCFYRYHGRYSCILSIPVISTGELRATKCGCKASQWTTAATMDKMGGVVTHIRTRPFALLFYIEKPCAMLIKLWSIVECVWSATSFGEPPMYMTQQWGLEKIPLHHT